MNEVAFFWGNASWRADQHWRPNEFLHWYALRDWKARGVKMFDWGGGGTYKEKYGVEPRGPLAVHVQVPAAQYAAQRGADLLLSKPVAGGQGA
jgi:hypothetical protein